MQTNSPILITGIERSGISIIARIVSTCDVFTGTCTDMTENIKVKKCMDSLYMRMGLVPKGQYPLPDTKNLAPLATWQQDIEASFNSEGCNGIPWMYKSSRISQTWPVWHTAFPNARWIIVRRKTPDIINSCLKTGFMTAFASGAYQKEVGAMTEADGWKWFIRQHEKIFVEMIEAGLNCRQLWPERMCSGDYLQIYETLEWCRLSWNENIVTKINPLLKKERVN